ncbi:hypothetical protein Acr_11g0004900 [Actinidia rufa]|uniref:Uncharacterized protein n=1 Tax=Actinidia rufa TaxID=165716 RepID=A0A7J0FBU2_9ERIC|nr:hypothetical protein Acr_11g0004900 [Actinidia rufa]
MIRNEVAESAKIESNLKDDPNQRMGSLGDLVEINNDDFKGLKNASQSAVQADTNVFGEVNMEASISSDDVIRAGGFGARDDINSFLPVASDSTDFEASLLDAREYEDPQEEIHRPGLGWTEATKVSSRLLLVMELLSLLIVPISMGHCNIKTSFTPLLSRSVVQLCMVMR